MKYDLQCCLSALKEEADPQWRCIYSPCSWNMRCPSLWQTWELALIYIKNTEAVLMWCPRTANCVLTHQLNQEKLACCHTTPVFFYKHRGHFYMLVSVLSCQRERAWRHTVTLSESSQKRCEGREYRYNNNNNTDTVGRRVVRLVPPPQTPFMQLSVKTNEIWWEGCGALWECPIAPFVV